MNKRTIPCSHSYCVSLGRHCFTLSTLVTLVRIVLTPCIVYAMYHGLWLSAFVLFSTAAATDALDGLLARMLGQQTQLGASLDPVADKILLVACFGALGFIHTPLFVVPQWFVFAILAKELLLVCGVILFYMVKGSVTIMPTLLGKLTTCVQIFFVMWLFACYFFGWAPKKTYGISLVLLVCLVFATLVQYGRIGIKMWRSS